MGHKHTQKTRQKVQQDKVEGGKKQIVNGNQMMVHCDAREKRVIKRPCFSFSGERV